MFKNTHQIGLLSVFSSLGSNPLALWGSKVRNGHVKRLTDEDVNSFVLEIISANVATTYINIPIAPHKTLAIKLPFLVMILKNMKKFVSFEVQILDDTNTLRRFRASNFQSCTSSNNFSTAMPFVFTSGWNEIKFNLADFTRRIYQTNYVETVRLQVNANVRIKQIYFSDRLYEEFEKPKEFKLCMSFEKKKSKSRRKSRASAAAKISVPPTARPSTPQTPATALETERTEATSEPVLIETDEQLPDDQTQDENNEVSEPALEESVMETEPPEQVSEKSSKHQVTETVVETTEAVLEEVSAKSSRHQVTETVVEMTESVVEETAEAPVGVTADTQVASSPTVGSLVRSQAGTPERTSVTEVAEEAAE